MTKLIIAIFAFLSIGFIQTNSQSITKLFYNLPLTADRRLIKEKILIDKNFKIRNIVSGFSEIDFVEASINKIHAHSALADSAILQLGSSYFYDENAYSNRLDFLKLTLYFKTNDYKNSEFDTIDKILYNQYKLRHFISSSLKHEVEGRFDTIYLKGTKYFITNQKKYPVLEISKNISEKNNFYIELKYLELNNSKR